MKAVVNEVFTSISFPIYNYKRLYYVPSTLENELLLGSTRTSTKRNLVQAYQHILAWYNFYDVVIKKIFFVIINDRNVEWVDLCWYFIHTRIKMSLSVQIHHILTFCIPSLLKRYWILNTTSTIQYLYCYFGIFKHYF